jgi:hypothetical protein
LQIFIEVVTEKIHSQKLHAYDVKNENVSYLTQKRKERKKEKRKKKKGKEKNESSYLLHTNLTYLLTELSPS